jgi:hypothetical protein
MVNAFVGHNRQMNSLSRIDRLAAQLRIQLERQSKRPGGVQMGASGNKGRADLSASGGQSPGALVRALHAAGVSDERVLVSCLIEGMLKRELGDEVGNASQFQQTVGMIVETLADNPETWALCQSCVAQALGAR